MSIYYWVFVFGEVLSCESQPPGFWSDSLQHRVFWRQMRFNSRASYEGRGLSEGDFGCLSRQQFVGVRSRCVNKHAHRFTRALSDGQPGVKERRSPGKLLGGSTQNHGLKDESKKGVDRSRRGLPDNAKPAVFGGACGGVSAQKPKGGGF